MTAGAVLERTNRRGRPVALLDLRNPASDWAGSEEEEGQRWMLVCLDHGGLLSMPTRHEAEAEITRTHEWCPTCQEES